MSINKQPIRTNLLKGIGIENFKSFSEYTYFSISDLSLFIGPNGSGKSSCWQLLSLLSACLQIEPHNDDVDTCGQVRKTRLSLRIYPDLGTKPHDLLFDQKKDLSIELHSAVLIKMDNTNAFEDVNNIQTETIIYKFYLRPNKNNRKDYNKNSDNSPGLFELNCFELLDQDRNILLNFTSIYDEIIKSPDDYLDEEYYKYSYKLVTEKSDFHSLGQYILNLFFKLNFIGLESFKDNPDIVEILGQPDAFYDLDNHGCVIRYAPGIRQGNKDSNFSYFLTDWQGKQHKGIHLLPASVDPEALVAREEVYEDACTKAESENPKLTKAAKLGFEFLRNTFRELLNEVGNIYILDKRKVGFSDWRINENSETGRLLSDLKSEEDLFNEHNWKLTEDLNNFTIDTSHPTPLEIMTGALQYYIDNNNTEGFKKIRARRTLPEIFRSLGFNDKPAIIHNVENKNFWIQHGDENMRNSGLGFWSLTFIVFALIKAYNRKSILFLEEPEINLHPNLQVELMDLLIDFSQNWNVRIVVETHSEYMLRRLQLRVHEGGHEGSSTDKIEEVKRMLLYNNFRSIKIKPEKAVVNSFELLRKTEGKNVYTCKVINFDQNGYLTKALPRSFSSIAANDALILHLWNTKDNQN
jgi:predicted ATP-dependent endonuclease of OLD family